MRSPAFGRYNKVAAREKLAHLGIKHLALAAEEAASGRSSRDGSAPATLPELRSGT
jgi:hypothetical protein